MTGDETPKALRDYFVLYDRSSFPQLGVARTAWQRGRPRGGPARPTRLRVRAGRPSFVRELVAPGCFLGA